MEYRRECSIDIAKGIGIFLLVLGHTDFSEYGVSVIHMAHMPLFFFFSGYCFKEKYLDDFRSFLIQRIKGLYLPLVKWGGVFLLLHNIFYKLNIYNEYFGFHGVGSHLLSVDEILKNAFSLVTTMNISSLLLGGYWFLKALFISSIISYVIIKIAKTYVIYTIPLLIIASIIMTTDNMPYLIGRLYGRCSLAAAVFLTGYIYHKQKIKLEDRPVYVIPFSLFLVFCGGYYFPMQMGDPRGAAINYLLYYLTTFWGIMLIFSISKMINKRKMFRRFWIYVGQNTLTVLTWHLLCFKIISYLIVNIYNYPVIHLAEFPVVAERSVQGWWILYLAIGFGTPLLLKCLQSKFVVCFSKRHA